MGKTIRLANDTYLVNDLYRTNETRVGTWTNGKPLYRKVIEGMTGNGDYGFDISSLNIDTMVDMWGTVGNNGDYKPINFYLYGYFLATRYNNGTMYVTASPEYANLPFNLIIEYTKTTD